MSDRLTRPPVDDAEAPTDSIAAFAADLKSLRAHAGGQPLEELSKNSGVSKTVLSDALAGHRLPTENTVRRLVDALGGDRAAWVERRGRLDPRFTTAAIATEAPPAPTAPQRRALLARTVSWGWLLAAMSVTAVLAVIVSGLIWPGRAAEGQADAAIPAPDIVYLDPADGVDPMQTACREDAVIAADQPFFDGAINVELKYSALCMAGWARVTRNDDLGAGNSLTIRVYPRDDPDGDRAQERTDTDLESLYTRMLIEPDIEARLCAIASYTVDGEEFVQPDPICG